MQLLAWFRRVMAGRYGGDQLMIGSVVLYMLLSVVAQLTRFYPLMLLAYVLLAWCIFRIFSRNISRRYQENQFFLKYWNRVRDWFSGVKRRVQDQKTHRYYKCPNCSNTLRVPRGRGKIQITCPVCGKQFVKKT